MVLEKIKDGLSALMTAWDDKRPHRVFIDVPADNIYTAAAFLLNDALLRFIIVSGIDRRDGFELLYHFSDDATGTVVTVRTHIADRQKPEIQSISALLKGAAWIEREIHELLGIRFTGNTNLKHLLLSDDWPGGNYPLRQDNNG
jgi:NADH:ubiquinone oxidoreductase subunit C